MNKRDHNVYVIENIIFRNVDFFIYQRVTVDLDVGEPTKTKLGVLI